MQDIGKIKFDLQVWRRFWTTTFSKWSWSTFYLEKTWHLLLDWRNIDQCLARFVANQQQEMVRIASIKGNYGARIYMDSDIENSLFI